ncbi:MAG: GDSL-type esterase/lipase family protein [Bacteroidota bacterium]
MNPKISMILFLNFCIAAALAQDPEWDDTSRPDWPEPFEEVMIPSSADGKMQMAYFYASQKKKPQPLVVSLHTWSNNYQQKDPLIGEILSRDVNYIRPDFRGPNNTQEACGSPLVASDIDDAIEYALKNSNADPKHIHVIGVSGGGHATLIAYMQSKYSIRSFSAWVPITDLAKWYDESIGRQRKYAEHIALATTGNKNKIDVQEAKNRSPLWMHTPVEKRKNSKLYIYAGIHDGYNGSVPITHSLEMYNKVVKDFNPRSAESLIPDNIIRELVVSRSIPGEKKFQIADRDIHYTRQYEDKLQIVIFEGGHEMLTQVALDHLESETILAIGDSNGQNKGGWVDRLRHERFHDVFYNTSISGNTIGFDNNGQESKNTLKNIRQHLTRYDPEKNHLTKILILLGTNDAKAVFHDRLNEVPGFYNQLIDSIETYYAQGKTPEVIMISPPPIANDDRLKEKYHGGAKRILYLNNEFRKVASQRQIRYIDLQSAIFPVYDELSRDGIHFNEQGYELVGFLLDRFLDQ